MLIEIVFRRPENILCNLIGQPMRDRQLTSVRISAWCTPPSSLMMSLISDPTVPVTGLQVNATG